MIPLKSQHVRGGGMRRGAVSPSLAARRPGNMPTALPPRAGDYQSVIGTPQARERWSAGALPVALSGNLQSAI